MTQALLYKPPEMPPDERRLLEDAAAWEWPQAAGEISAGDLARLAAVRGIDFATSVLYDRLRRRSTTDNLMREDVPIESSPDLPPPRDALLAIVPGALYREYPNTGADGKVIRDIAESLGWSTELVPLPSDGPPEPNGEMLLEWLECRADRPVLLLSLSKGGTDVKAAMTLAANPNAFRSVIGWIDFGGILDGSPMASWVLQRRLARWFFRGLFRCTGHDFRMMTALLYRSGGPTSETLRLPEHLQTIHVAGFPLRRHLSNARARRWHKRLSVWGPNDSVTILADVASWPGTVWPVWGTDHYLQFRWQPVRLVTNLLRCVAQQAVGPPAGSQAPSLIQH